jgi:hypothetical protein
MSNRQDNCFQTTCQENNQKLEVCGAQFRDGFPEIEAISRVPIARKAGVTETRDQVLQTFAKHGIAVT